MVYSGQGMTLQAGPLGRTTLAEDPAVKPAGLVAAAATGTLKNGCPDPQGAPLGWAPGTVICWLPPFQSV